MGYMDLDYKEINQKSLLGSRKQNNDILHYWTTECNKTSGYWSKPIFNSKSIFLDLLIAIIILYIIVKNLLKLNKFRRWTNMNKIQSTNKIFCQNISCFCDKNFPYLIFNLQTLKWLPSIFIIKLIWTSCFI